MNSRFPAPTFIEFLVERRGEMSGWFNVRKNKAFEEDVNHAYLLGQHWQDVMTREEMEKGLADENAARERLRVRRPDLKVDLLDPNEPEDQAMAVGDAEYGRFYKEGWVRWYNPGPYQVLEFTSTKETLNNSREKIIEIVEKYQPTYVLLSDKYSEGSHGTTFEKILNGDDVRSGKLDI